jgi:hypothetical protein
MFILAIIRESGHEYFGDNGDNQRNDHFSMYILTIIKKWPFLHAILGDNQRNDHFYMYISAIIREMTIFT